MAIRDSLLGISFIIILILITVLGLQTVMLHNNHAAAQKKMKVSPALESPFEYCANVKEVEFSDFEELVKNCTKLDNKASNYPMELNRCVCSIFISKTNNIYWYSFRDPFFIELAKSIAGNWTYTGPIEPEGLFVDHYSGRSAVELGAAKSDIIKKASENKYSWHKSSSWTLSSSHEDGWQLYYQHCNYHTGGTHGRVELIWKLLERFYLLTRRVHFGRILFNSSNEGLRDLLFQHGLCKALKQLF